MITKPAVFEDDHLPDRLLHRHTEKRELARGFKPITRGEPSEYVLLAGPSGVGKTALARSSLEDVSDFGSVDTGFVRAMGKRTGSILRDIIDEHPREMDVSHSTPVEELPKRLAAATTRPYVVVLDEADDLPSTDVLDALRRCRWVSVVVVTHDQTRFESRTSAPFSITLNVDRFKSAELADILEARAHEGLQGGVVSRGQLESIADTVAGVARWGIQSLRAAAELASERGHSTIKSHDVRDCYERARGRIRASNLQSLPVHHHVLYEIVRQAGACSGEEVHDQYERVADRVYDGLTVAPVGRRSRRNKLAKLAAYDLIDFAEERGGRRYRVLDEDLESEVVALPSVRA